MTLPLSKRWQISQPLTSIAAQNLAQYPPVLQQLLFNRGHATAETAQRYLDAAPPPHSEPENMLGIPQAVERIRYALQTEQTIAVYGDYDVDGVTATALLTQVLRGLGGSKIIPYIPNRFEEGYGLNREALELLKEWGVKLVITVDCGIRSLPEAEFTQHMGMDLIISDHHHPHSELPVARAIINPKQPGDEYPYKDLAGVGLAYKLGCALRGEDGLGGPLLAGEMQAMLDLVALGTVADLAPLTGENRALVRSGLRELQRGQRQGLRSLMGAAGIQPGGITAMDIGYGLGPRLNAAGRLESAMAALELLLEQDIQTCGLLAQQLDNQNRERQQQTRQIQEQAEVLAFKDKIDPFLLVAIHPDYNPGIVGLAASRLTEQWYRPSIVGQIGEETTRASCRSIPEYHITDALDACADLMEHHGGHAAAAGFTVCNENLPKLLERLQAHAETVLSGLDLRPALVADLEIPLRDLHPEIIAFQQGLQPTGYGNPQALYVSRGLKVERYKVIGKENNHLRLTVSDGRITYDAVAFRQARWAEIMPTHVDLAYNFELNEFNGRTNLQLNVRDIKPAGTPD